MPHSNYLNGITVRGDAITQTYPGKVFWVNNSLAIAKDGIGGSDLHAGTYQKPFSSITHAIQQCVNNRGDIILVMPGYLETLTTDDLLCNVEDIAIIGLGTGTLRPTINFTSSGSISVTAANVTWSNCIFNADGAIAGDVGEVFSVLATNLLVEDCYFKGNGIDTFDELFITSSTDNEADGLTMIGCKWIGTNSSPISACNLFGTIDSVTLLDNYIHMKVNGTNPILINLASGQALTNVIIENNTCIRLMTDGSLLIKVDQDDDSFGVIRNNTVRHADTAGETLIPSDTTISMSNNLCSAVDDKSGYLLPANA